MQKMEGGLISMPLDSGMLASSQHDKDTYKKGDAITKIKDRKSVV